MDDSDDVREKLRKIHRKISRERGKTGTTQKRLEWPEDRSKAELEGRTAVERASEIYIYILN